MGRYKTISDLMINEQIRDKEIRLVGEDGAQLGVMPTREAMRMAEEAGLMVHIRRLREKIEDDPCHPEFIKTVWGKGYRVG